MKKLSNIFIALLLGIVALFSFAGCGSANQKELQSKIDESQSKIDELQSKIEEMEESLEEKNGQISELHRTIVWFGKQLGSHLGDCSEDPLHSLQAAYYYGWITREELMSIAYYHNGGRVRNEEIMNEAYAPAPKTPGVLSEETELKIKSAAAEDFNKNQNVEYAEAEGIIITEYCGTYGDCVVIMVKDIYSGGPGIVWTESIAGVNFYYNFRSLRVWRQR